MKRKSLLAILLLAFAGFLQAEAIKDIKPGLWEIQHKTSVDGQALPDMNKMLEQVPPEMRGQVQAMMAKHGAGTTDKGVSICITPEQIANQQYGSDPKRQCQMSDTKHEGNVTHMKVACSKPKSEGETTITRLNSEAWTAITTMTMEQNGAPHTMNSEATAKWLAADCGDVKPAAVKKAVDTKAVDASAADVKAIDTTAIDTTAVAKKTEN